MWSSEIPISSKIDYSEMKSSEARELADIEISNEFYSQLWESQSWGGCEPNPDEQSRLTAIAEMISLHLSGTSPLTQILDVGCGRGWLSGQLSRYGTVQGIEVVPQAIDIARNLFPDINFSIADPIDLNQADIERYGNADLVVCSEVIEHVPRATQGEFCRGIASLVKPGGYVIITTPRGEFWNQWKQLVAERQPVEDWVTEKELKALFVATGLYRVSKTRVYCEGHEYHPFTGWLLKRNVSRQAIRRIGPIYRAILHANAIYQVTVFRKSSNSILSPN